LTKEGLRKAKERGVKLGNPDMDAMRTKGVAAIKEGAYAFAKNIMPTIKELMARDKIKSYNAIARALNREEVRTARGGKWRSEQVRLIFIRCNESFY
jgi:hypothetical protein